MILEGERYTNFEEFVSGLDAVDTPDDFRVFMRNTNNTEEGRRLFELFEDFAYAYREVYF